MSSIMVSIGGIAGEASQTGYEDQIECMAMRHAIDLTTVVDGQTRVEGTSRHGPIALTHPIDKSTPALKLAASQGTNLGKVVITRLRTGNVVAEQVTINNAFVVRIDTDTPHDLVNREPADEPVETFCLEYSDIVWNFKHFVNDMQSGQAEGSWSVALQSIEFPG